MMKIFSQSKNIYSIWWLLIAKFFSNLNICLDYETCKFFHDLIFLRSDGFYWFVSWDIKSNWIKIFIIQNLKSIKIISWLMKRTSRQIYLMIFMK